LDNKTKNNWSRRQVVVGGSMALACANLPASAQTQPIIAPDGFRILPVRLASLGIAEPGGAVVIWGYDGAAPGPTLRVRRGEEIRVRLVNGMKAPTTVHWHGVRLANAMDGSPPLTQEPIRPGASFDYRFTLPDAGTFWYHADPEQTAQGLAGLLIVEESERVEVSRDVALLIQELKSGLSHLRPIEVNGAPNQDIPVEIGDRVRLRLLNVTRRVLRVQIAGLRCWVMAIDGQPAEPFLARESRIALAPGNRVDLFVDVAMEAGGNVPILLQDGPTTTTIARLVSEASGTVARAPLPDPKPLPSNRLPERMDFARAQRATVPIDAGTLTADAARAKPLFSVRRGRTVVLALVNRTEAAHAMHLHGHHARLLDRLDDGWKPFWIDTVLVEARATQRIAFVADNPGKWAIDGRAIDQDLAGMAGWFEVT
jgi:FtsP/CotA-like multicopper oxidase with cupredoxin domain